MWRLVHVSDTPSIRDDAFELCQSSIADSSESQIIYLYCVWVFHVHSSTYHLLHTLYGHHMICNGKDHMVASLAFTIYSFSFLRTKDFLGDTRQRLIYNTVGVTIMDTCCCSTVSWTIILGTFYQFITTLTTIHVISYTIFHNSKRPSSNIYKNNIVTYGINYNVLDPDYYTLGSGAIPHKQCHRQQQKDICTLYVIFFYIFFHISLRCTRLKFQKMHFFMYVDVSISGYNLIYLFSFFFITLSEILIKVNLIFK